MSNCPVDTHHPPTTWPTLRIPTSSQIRSLVSNWRGSLRFGHLALLAIFGLFVFWLSWNWNDFFPFSGCFHRFWVIEYDEVTKKGNFLKYVSGMLMIKNIVELESERRQTGRWQVVFLRSPLFRMLCSFPAWPGSVVDLFADKHRICHTLYQWYTESQQPPKLISSGTNSGQAGCCCAAAVKC